MPDPFAVEATAAPVDLGSIAPAPAPSPDPDDVRPPRPRVTIGLGVGMLATPFNSGFPFSPNVASVRVRLGRGP